MTTFVVGVVCLGFGAALEKFFGLRVAEEVSAELHAMEARFRLMLATAKTDAKDAVDKVL